MLGNLSTDLASAKLAARYHPLVIVLAAVAAGIVADRYGPLPAPAWWALAVGMLAAWAWLWTHQRQRSAGVAVLLAAFACGAAWHHCCWSLFADDDLGGYATAQGQPICIEAVARTDPRLLPAGEFDPMQGHALGDRTRVHLAVTALRDGAQWRPASGLAMLTVTGRLAGISAGDRVRIFGQLAAPHKAANPGEFDYAEYVRADRRRSVLRTERAECVSIVERAGFCNLRHWIEGLRTAGDRLFANHLDDRNSALASAVLLGVREDLTVQESRAFFETGTIHILSISGVHVAIVAGVIYFFARLMLIPQRRAIVIVALATVLYTMLTDSQPPAVRATLLVLITCLCYALGRQPLPFNSLAAAALVVLALNPADLFRMGPQLSFLAAAGLMWFVPRLRFMHVRRDPLAQLVAAGRGWPERAWRYSGQVVCDLTAVSLVIVLLTLPLVVARFHIVSPISIALNTIIFLPMAAALWSGFLLLGFGWLIPPLGAAAGWCCNRFIGMVQNAVDLGAAIPGGHFWVAGPADWWLIGFYGGLAALVAFRRLRPPRRWCVGLLAVWSTIGLAVSLVPWEGPQLQCTFLSVGHGLAVVVELPCGKTILYDCGRLSTPAFGAQAIAGFLWSRGVNHLDAVVLSHADIDHYNALPELLKQFSVGVVYVSPRMFERGGAAVAALRRAIESAEARVEQLAAGDRLVDDDCQIEVLHPPRRAAPASDNANSVVLAVEYRNRRILLTGDLELPGIQDVLAEEPLDCDVLLVPHHGSAASDSPELVAWCTPEVAIVSGGSRGDPARSVAGLARAGARVFRTSASGAIRVVVDASGRMTATSMLSE